MIFLHKGDLFLHSRNLDCDNHPLVCEVTDIQDNIVEWRRADCSWTKIHNYFLLTDIKNHVLKIL